MPDNIALKDGNGAAFTGRTVEVSTGIHANAVVPVDPTGSPYNLLTEIGDSNDASAGSDTGNFSLIALFKRLLTKIPALESSRLMVAVQREATTTRAYDFPNGQRLTTAGSGQVRSGAISATEVLLHASVRGFFRIGDNSVSATIGAGSIPLAVDEKFHCRLTSGQFISFIRDGSLDGSLTIMPVTN
jgi:hypothetical protein